MMHQLTPRVLPTQSRQLVKLVTSTRPISTNFPLQTKKQRPQHLESNQNTEWRELFRSTDFDDAWSPYIPIKKNSTDNSNPKDKLNEHITQSSPINSLIEGKWQKRQHGMNLVPLNVKPKESITIINIELQQALAQNEGRLKWLDSQTRFLCSMLDDLYRTGIRRQIDRGRTERCHRVSFFIARQYLYHAPLILVELFPRWRILDHRKAIDIVTSSKQ